MELAAIAVGQRLLKGPPDYWNRAFAALAVQRALAAMDAAAGAA